MKNTILKTTMLAAIASLAMSGYAWAHHPAADMVDEETYATIEENISDNHIEIIDDMLEDAEDDSLMSSTSEGMDGGEATTAEGVGANASQTSNMGAVPTTASGISTAGQSRSGR